MVHCIAVNYAVIGLAILYIQHSHRKLTMTNSTDGDSAIEGDTASTNSSLSEAEIASLIASGSYACLYLISAFSTILASFESISELIALGSRVLELSDALTRSYKNPSLGCHHACVNSKGPVVELTGTSSDINLSDTAPSPLVLFINKVDILRPVNICRDNYERQEDAKTQSRYSDMDASDTSPLISEVDDEESILASGTLQESRVLIPKLSLKIYRGM